MLDEHFYAAARALIAADSVTDRGNLRAVEVIEPLCREAGLEPVRLPSPDTPEIDANLLAGPGGGAGAKGEPLLLVTHLDTVDPGPLGRWRTHPFTLHVDGDRAYGLGTADVKLDALCKLWAARRLRGQKLARPFYFLGTYGEEAGLRGARAFVEQLPVRPAFVLCGEPSELKIHSSHKGYAMVRVTISPRRTPAPAEPRALAEMTFVGRAVHSSTPHLGVNAVDLALDALMRADAPRVLSLDGGASTNAIPGECRVVVEATTGELRVQPRYDDVRIHDLPKWDGAPGLTAEVLHVASELRRRWAQAVTALSPAEDARFDPAHAVANLTRARTRGAALELNLDARLLPAHDPEALLTAFGREAMALADERVAVELSVERRGAGLTQPDDAEIVKRAGEALASLGLDGRPYAKPTSTEAGTFSRAGIPAVVFGPSLSAGNVHAPNEHARLREVERAIDCYEALIRAFCARS